MDTKIPAGAVRVPLSRPIDGHGGPVREVILREPTARDFFRLGEPFAQAYGKDGGDGTLVYQAENNDVVQAYLEALIIVPDVIVIGGLSLADAMRVKAALLGFFRDAREAQSEMPATPSSLTSESSTPAAAAT